MSKNPSEADLQLQDTLNSWNGKLIHITKQQNRDIDETTMTLSGVNFHERQPTIDGYVSPFVLQLHGKGRMATDHAQYEKIPYETFEIPLTEQHQINLQKNQIQIQTTDRNYTIKYH